MPCCGPATRVAFSASPSASVSLVSTLPVTIRSSEVVIASLTASGVRLATVDSMRRNSAHAAAPNGLMGAVGAVGIGDAAELRPTRLNSPIRTVATGEGAGPAGAADAAAKTTGCGSAKSAVAGATDAAAGNAEGAPTGSS